MHDLTSLIDPGSGWIITDATGINDAGQIAATGCGPPGCHALLLTPVKTTVVEYQNTLDFPGSPGGHFFYTDDPVELAIVDSGIAGHFVRTGRTFNAGGTKHCVGFMAAPRPVRIRTSTHSRIRSASYSRRCRRYRRLPTLSNGTTRGCDFPRCRRKLVRMAWNVPRARFPFTAPTTMHAHAPARRITGIRRIAIAAITPILN